MIKTAARNIQIISPIRPKPFAVRLIALPKSSSFASEIFGKYSGIVETDMTAAPFVFLDMFGKELAEEREQYYKMMLTLRLMIAQKLVVTGKLGDPTVSRAYSSSVSVMISGALNYFRNSSNIIYNKLTDARKIVEAADESRLAEAPDKSGMIFAGTPGVLRLPEHTNDLPADERNITQNIAETGAAGSFTEVRSVPEEGSERAGDVLIYSFSEGEERWYRELLEKTVSETIFENIGSYPVDTQSLILRRYEHISAEQELPAVRAGENRAEDAGGTVTAESRGINNDVAEETELPVLTHAELPRGTERVAQQATAAEISEAVPVIVENPSRRRDSAVSRINAGEGENYIPLMNTMMSGGAGYFAGIAGKYVHGRTLPVSVIRPFIGTVRRKKLSETFPLVVKALDILTAPEKANSQERAVYEYAVSTVLQRRTLPMQSELYEVFSQFDRKERTDALVLAVNRLIKVSGKEAGRTIKYTDGKNRKRELSPAESALIWAIVRDERGEAIGELSRSVKNNAVINRLEKLYSAPGSGHDMGHAAVINNIERILSVKGIIRNFTASPIAAQQNDSVHVMNTYNNFSVLSLLMSAGKEGAAAAAAVLPEVINTEKTIYSQLPVRSPSMTLRKSERVSDRTFYEEFFEKLVSRNITLSEVGAIGRELSKDRPAGGVIIKRVENILRNISSAVTEAAEDNAYPGTADITLFSRMNEKLYSSSENHAVKMPERHYELYREQYPDRYSESTAVLREPSPVSRNTARSADRADISAYVTETERIVTEHLTGVPVVFPEKTDISASVRNIFKEITKNTKITEIPKNTESGAALSIGAVSPRQTSTVKGTAADITITRRTAAAHPAGAPAADEKLTSENVRVIAETLMHRDDRKAKITGDTLMKLLNATNITNETAAPVFRTEANGKASVRTLAKLVSSLAASGKRGIAVSDNTSAAMTRHDTVTGRPADTVYRTAGTEIQKSSAAENMTAPILRQDMTTRRAADPDFPSAASGIQRASAAQGISAPMTRSDIIAGRTADTVYRTAASEAPGLIISDNLPAPELLYDIMTQRPAGYIGGTLRRLSAGNIRTLARRLSLPSALSASSAETSSSDASVQTTASLLPPLSLLQPAETAENRAETLPPADMAQLNYRSSAPAAQQTSSSGRRAPTKEDLVEQFGNLIDGIDPTKPMSSAKKTVSVTADGKELEETIEKLRKTTEKTETNTKLIEELSKKQHEIEKSLRRSSDIGTISEEVMRKLRIQLRFDSSRFMS